MNRISISSRNTFLKPILTNRYFPQCTKMACLAATMFSRPMVSFAGASVLTNRKLPMEQVSSDNSLNLATNRSASLKECVKLYEAVFIEVLFKRDPLEQARKLQGKLKEVEASSHWSIIRDMGIDVDQLVQQLLVRGQRFFFEKKCERADKYFEAVLLLSVNCQNKLNIQRQVAFHFLLRGEFTKAQTLLQSMIKEVQSAKDRFKAILESDLGTAYLLDALHASKENKKSQFEEALKKAEQSFVNAIAHDIGNHFILLNAQIAPLIEFGSYFNLMDVLFWPESFKPIDIFSAFLSLKEDEAAPIQQELRALLSRL